MSTWSSRHGKFVKKDPNHGKLGRWIKDNWNAFWRALTKDNKKDKSPRG